MRSRWKSGSSSLPTRAGAVRTSCRCWWMLSRTTSRSARSPMSTARSSASTGNRSSSRGMAPMSDAIRIVKAATHKPKPKDAELGFGQIFTDHMFLADFQEEKGWYDPRVEPYGPLALDPAAAVLHYAQSIFDGLKAFRGVDGKVRLFRPQKHVERMTNSAKRLCIPPLDQGLALQSIVTLVGLEREWVPKTIGTSLYIRPTIVASEPFLGVRPAKSYVYFIILSPEIGRASCRERV